MLNILITSQPGFGKTILSKTLEKQFTQLGFEAKRFDEAAKYLSKKDVLNPNNTIFKLCKGVNIFCLTNDDKSSINKLAKAFGFKKFDSVININQIHRAYGPRI